MISEIFCGYLAEKYPKNCYDFNANCVLDTGLDIIFSSNFMQIVWKKTVWIRKIITYLKSTI